jgi:hypothetical protein
MEQYVQEYKFQVIFVMKAEQKIIPSAFLTLELLCQVSFGREPFQPPSLPVGRDEDLCKGGEQLSSMAPKKLSLHHCQDGSDSDWQRQSSRWCIQVHTQKASGLVSPPGL